MQKLKSIREKNEPILTDSLLSDIQENIEYDPNNQDQTNSKE